MWDTLECGCRRVELLAGCRRAAYAFYMLSILFQFAIGWAIYEVFYAAVTSKRKDS